MGGNGVIVFTAYLQYVEKENLNLAFYLESLYHDIVLTGMTFIFNYWF